MRRRRQVVQFGFLALTLVAVFVLRAHAELWCPFGGIEALYGFFSGDGMPCSLAISNLYILAAILLLTLVAGRVFCSYACPIGTLSEWVQRAASRFGLRPRRVPHRLDRALGYLRFGVLAAILVLTYRTGELIFRGFDPCYALLSRHGEDITYWAYGVAGAIVAGSLWARIPFCRWLCPLAAVLHPFSRFAIARIHRDETPCIACGRCAVVCPAHLPVDRVTRVSSGDCTSCFECLHACPARARGALRWGPRRGRWSPATAIGLLLLSVGAAVAAAQLFPVPSFRYERGVMPEETARLALTVEGLTCRGRGTLLAFFLDRDDELRIPGYLALEAWPDPLRARIVLTYDPSLIDEQGIKLALTEATFDLVENRWRASPFRIEGFDPLKDLGL